VLTEALSYHPLPGMTGETAVEEALRSRAAGSLRSRRITHRARVVS